MKKIYRVVVSGIVGLTLAVGLLMITPKQVEAQGCTGNITRGWCDPPPVEPPPPPQGPFLGCFSCHSIFH